MVVPVLTAWADESGSRPDLDPGAYLLAACLCEEDNVSEVRKTLAGLRIGEPKLHWHGSSDEREELSIPVDRGVFRRPPFRCAGRRLRAGSG